MDDKTLKTIAQWRGADVVDRDGDKIGTLEEIYLDRHDDEPEWALVKTGLFGGRGSFVPLAGAQPEGDNMRVAYAKDRVKDAPKIDPDGEISPEEETTLYRHYGLDFDPSDRGSGTAGEGGERDAGGERSAAGTSAGTSAGAATRGEGGRGEDDRGERDAGEERTAAGTSGGTSPGASARGEGGRGDDDRSDADSGRETSSGTGGRRLRRYLVTEEVSGGEVQATHKEKLGERDS